MDTWFIVNYNNISTKCSAKKQLPIKLTSHLLVNTSSPQIIDELPVSARDKPHYHIMKLLS